MLKSIIDSSGLEKDSHALCATVMGRLPRGCEGRYHDWQYYLTKSSLGSRIEKFPIHIRIGSLGRGALNRTCLSSLMDESESAVVDLGFAGPAALEVGYKRGEY